MNTVTDFVFPILFINLNIMDFLRKGIFLPSCEISLVNNRYKFSCFFEKFNFIRGHNFVA